MADTTPTRTPTRTPTARPARPPLPQLLCPLTRYGPHRRKTKAQAAQAQAQSQPPPDPPPPPSPAASYPGATMRIAVTADERVVGVEQFDCLPDQQSKKEEEEAERKAAGDWVEIDLTAEAEAKEKFDVISLEEEGGGGRKTLLKDSDVERVMLEAERDVEVFVEMVRAQGRRVRRWAEMVGLGRGARREVGG